MMKLHYFPTGVFIIFPATFITTFSIAILLGHVEVDFPYISDTGTTPPESCIFSQLLTVGTVLLGITVYVRYRQILEYHPNHSSSSTIIRLNHASLWLGIIAAFGVSIVSNFQETSVFVVHMIGAFLAFGVGTAYIWLQTVLSYKMHPVVNTLFMAHFRTALSLITTVFFFISSICGTLARLQFHGKNMRKWYPEDGGFQLHVASTASEWVMASAFNVFILTFVREFQKISMNHPELCLFEDQSALVQASYHTVSAEQYKVPGEMDYGSIITHGDTTHWMLVTQMPPEPIEILVMEILQSSNLFTNSEAKPEEMPQLSRCHSMPLFCCEPVI
ncbi:unnamed protein product [Darwinula stevensoni]|uniref:CWH43-like N-terminal domain-containing protein n=1 Tax=Darwinula stevensoni TaxID=69355 RepID=A0A7R9A4E4_9CRUS|nr:unnamed protein product [Darwinula stevensoni]CAG0883191.1 unnamed protein product [Darwinula stevensoni]